MKKICFISCILLLASNCFSQNNIVSVFHLDSIPAEGVLLDKDWKFHSGDNAEWARPEFDDKDWTNINPVLAIHELPNVRKAGIGWIRLRLNVDSALQNKTVALVINT